MVFSFDPSRNVSTSGTISSGNIPDDEDFKDGLLGEGEEEIEAAREVRVGVTGGSTGVLVPPGEEERGGGVGDAEVLKELSYTSTKKKLT